MKRSIAWIAMLVFMCLFSCSTDRETAGRINPRTFMTSFESVADFADFYIVPQNTWASDHELSTEMVYDGIFSHKAWITAARDTDNDGTPEYLPHRAYPTVQFQKTQAGVFHTPCLVSIMVYLDIALLDRPADSIDDWFSFITVSPDASDAWNRTIVVNLTPDGYLKLVHVPLQGQQDRLYQASSANDPGALLLFPLRTWTKIDVFIDFSESGGYAKVWQDGKLVSHALVKGGFNTLAQAHCGLYASAAISAGTIYNDALSIREIDDETEALSIIGGN